MSDIDPSSPVRAIPIEQIVKGKYQPRIVFTPEWIAELAASIQATGGITNPVIVRPLPPHHGEPRFELVAGEQRWRAAQLANFETVPALVREMDDERAAILSVSDNLARKDLNPIEEARGFQVLHEEFDKTHQEIALLCGKGDNRTYVTKALRLLQLDSRIQDYISTGSLTATHGLVLLEAQEGVRMRLAKQAVAGRWSVSRLRLAIAGSATTKKGAKGSAKDSNWLRLEESASNTLGLPLVIDRRGKANKKGYEIHIVCTSDDELEGFLQRIGYRGSD